MSELSPREQAINSIVELLQYNPFEIEFVVVDKPRGIKVVVELTQEEMDEMTIKKGGE